MLVKVIHTSCSFLNIILIIDLSQEEAWKLGWDSNVQEEIHKDITTLEKVKMCIELRQRHRNGSEKWRDVCKDMLQEYRVSD